MSSTNKDTEKKFSRETAFFLHRITLSTCLCAPIFDIHVAHMLKYNCYEMLAND